MVGKVVSARVIDLNTERVLKTVDEIVGINVLATLVSGHVVLGVVALVVGVAHGGDGRVGAGGAAGRSRAGGTGGRGFGSTGGGSAGEHGVAVDVGVEGKLVVSHGVAGLGADYLGDVGVDPAGPRAGGNGGGGSDGDIREDAA